MPIGYAVAKIRPAFRQTFAISATLMLSMTAAVGQTTAGIPYVAQFSLAPNIPKKSQIELNGNGYIVLSPNRELDENAKNSLQYFDFHELREQQSQKGYWQGETLAYTTPGYWHETLTYALPDQPGLLFHGGSGSGSGPPLVKPLTPDEVKELMRNLESVKALNDTVKIETVCEAMRKQFSLKRDSSCYSIMRNDSDSVRVQIYTIDEVKKRYELVIKGESIQLAFRHDNWVERYKVYLTVGFDAQLTPQLTVTVYEARVTHSASMDAEEAAFQNPDPNMDPAIDVFQKALTNSLIAAIMEQKYAQSGDTKK
jgi:hypothetical protein